ncbi:hypothetical protein [Comamonas sp.]|uniref:hypothetical protein n=1 Tax=Comamonas sp. TaxID=34028 RepID=UPI00289C250C|nr:hypothetical protein [Comamonas sp.]
MYSSNDAGSFCLTLFWMVDFADFFDLPLSLSTATAAIISPRIMQISLIEIAFAVGAMAKNTDASMMIFSWK